MATGKLFVRCFGGQGRGFPTMLQDAPTILLANAASLTIAILIFVVSLALMFLLPMDYLQNEGWHAMLAVRLTQFGKLMASTKTPLLLFTFAPVLRGQRRWRADRTVALRLILMGIPQVSRLRIRLCRSIGNGREPLLGGCGSAW